MQMIDEAMTSYRVMAEALGTEYATYFVIGLVEQVLAGAIILGLLLVLLASHIYEGYMRFCYPYIRKKSTREDR